MQTITTKYVPATGRRGSRIIATASGSGDRVSVAYDYEDNDGGHGGAALELMIKMGWGGRMISGDTKTGKVWVFVGGNEISNMGNGGAE